MLPSTKFLKTCITIQERGCIYKVVNDNGSCNVYRGRVQYSETDNSFINAHIKIVRYILFTTKFLVQTI